MPDGSIQDPDPPTGSRVSNNRTPVAGKIGGVLFCFRCQFQHIYVSGKKFKAGDIVSFDHADFNNSNIRVAINVTKK